MFSPLRGSPGPAALLFLALASLTRISLLFWTGAAAVPPAIWTELLLRGLGFDLAVLAWLQAPGWLGTALWPARWHLRQTWSRLLGFFLFAFALLFLVLAEWAFWLEFASRFNFIAVDYLIYTQEVVGNVVESYPVGGLLTGVAILAAGLTWLARKWLLRPVEPSGPAQRLTLAALAVLLPWLAWQGADIDRMRFSDNAYANELAGNGLMTFAAALRRNELDYSRFYATLPPAQARRILAELDVERVPLSAVLKPDADADEGFDPQRLPFRRPPRNVVLMTVESLSAEYLGVFGNPDGLTPRLDGLARDGLLFTHVYATGTRTVRGLEALSLGTPPIPGQAIVRRPGNDHLATLGEILKRQGYATYFFYGGYGYFDNMNAYFAGNDYQVVDRTGFPKSSVSFANVWGVADEYLYDNALGRLDAAHAQGRPFLAQIMTTSNHRPYTYPDGRIDLPSPGGRKGAIKYSDYALGRFIDQARARPWFADTLFVIVADHCASVAGKAQLPVKGYRIPLIFYAPGLLKPGRQERLASQIDVAPTVLDVMGLAGDDHFFGKSLFEQAGDAPRAFISNYQELGYLKAGRLTVLGPKRRVEAFLVDDQGNATPAPVDPRLRDEAVAYYQSAFQAFKQGELKLPNAK